MAQEDRKSAVIVFTEIAGFAERMAANEDAAFSLIETQRELLRPIIEKYKVVWIKEMGDGLLLMFDSARTCVDCCIELQHTAKPVTGLDIRISIHLGEVILASEDIYGDEVKIASRIKKYSPVGGIAISENIKASISKSKKYETTFIGTPVLKGVEREVGIYAITSHDLPGPAATNLQNPETRQASTPDASKIDQQSLLVTPFVSLSRRGEDEVVSDGMTDALISHLSKGDVLQIISSTSAMQYKNTMKKASEIAGELGLRYMIEGSILIIGDQIQIKAGLIDAEKGKQIWSDSYECPFKNILQVFKEVSAAVIDGIKKSMMIASAPRQNAVASEEARVVDPEAYKVYLQGRQLRQKKDFHSMELATKSLRDSIGIDPTFGATYAELALTMIMRGAFGYVPMDHKLRDDVQLTVDNALTLDERLAEAYLALALTWEFIDHDSEQAAQFAQQAVTLDPGNTEAIQEEAFILGRLERFDEAFAKMNQTLLLDPLSTSARNGLGYLYLYQDKYADAIREMRNLLEIDSSHDLARLVISLAQTGLGEYELAHQALIKMPREKINIHVIAQRGFLSGKMGDVGNAERHKAALELGFSDDPLFNFSLALIELGLGHENRCVEELGASQERHGFIYRDKTIGRDFRMDDMQDQIQDEGLIYV